MSTPTVDIILVALKPREMINVVDSYLLQCGRPICKGELCNSLCSVFTSEGIKSMDVFESYGCLTENRSFKSALTVHSAHLR